MARPAARVEQGAAWPERRSRQFAHCRLVPRPVPFLLKDGALPAQALLPGAQLKRPPPLAVSVAHSTSWAARSRCRASSPARSSRACSSAAAARDSSCSRAATALRRAAARSSSRAERSLRRCSFSVRSFRARCP